MRLILAILVLMFYTGVYAETLAAPSVPVYTQDKLAVIVTSAQPQFIVKLKSNPTTGYGWFLRDYNSALLEPVSHGYEAATDKKLMGAPGFEIWTFRVKPSAFVVPQQSMVRFVYTRPWEAGETGMQLMFKVTMENKK
jgi:inhibitor of cysteine peptidase